MTEATAATATSCSTTATARRCGLYVGGPTYDTDHVMTGCDVTWKCPEGVVGFVCSGAGGQFDCRCVKDDGETHAFSWTGDPCTRQGTAATVARHECTWSVP